MMAGVNPIKPGGLFLPAARTFFNNFNDFRYGLKILWLFLTFNIPLNEKLFFLAKFS